VPKNRTEAVVLRRTPLILALALVLALPCTAGATVGKPAVAALQVALRAQALYHGPIDGLSGKMTRAAIRDLQARRGLPVDGIAGPATRSVLGRLGRHPIGSRPLRAGMVGFDVSALQFALGWHGFPSGAFDGVFGPRLDTACRRFQHWAGLTEDGVAGPATLRALSRRLPRSPVRFSLPVDAPFGDGFGPRGDRFHAGIDLLASGGTSVRAGRAGVVVFTGWNDGFGKLVILDHGRGITSYYAHLRRIDVRQGQRVARGACLGRVGSTGNSSGPHLHFEIRVRYAAVDPLPALR
jgi:peptidoglycan hydrolase-like protein with peptidoglycan-binding domain